MIVKMQTAIGSEWIDKVRRVSTGPEMQDIETRCVRRHIDISIVKGDDMGMGPYTDFTLVFENGEVEMIRTNGPVYILNENGKTVDRF